MVAQTFRVNHGKIMQRASETQDMNTGLVCLFVIIVISFFLTIIMKRTYRYYSKQSLQYESKCNDNIYSGTFSIMQWNGVWLIYALGNDAIHDLTKSGKAKLRIRLKRFNGEQGNITYSTFKVRSFQLSSF